MQILASKFIYPEEQRNLAEVLSSFKEMGIQLSFFKHQDFFKMRHNFIKEVCDSLNINITTVHAPTVDVFDEDFLEVIEEIKRIYKTSLISIHPQKGELSLSLAKLKDYAKIFAELEVILAYENFPSIVGKRKWICTPSQMHSYFNLDFLKLTFDTSHLDSPSDCIQEMSEVFDKVAVIHLSDKDRAKEHLPLGSGCVPYQKFIEYLKRRRFSGPLVLEYMPEYEDRLIEDVKRLKDNL